MCFGTKTKSAVIVIAIMLAACGITGCNADDKQSTELVSTETDSTGDSEDAASAEENSEKMEEVKEAIAIPAENAEFACALPKGFSAKADEEGFYVTRKYPTDIASISYAISDENIVITQDELGNALEKDYLNTYGDTVKINFTEFMQTEVDGCPATRIVYNYEFKGDDYEDIEIIINCGTEGHVFTFSHVPGDKWLDEFETSISTIKRAE